MKAKVWTALAVTALTAAAQAQDAVLQGADLSLAINCVKAYQSPKQEECFNKFPTLSEWTPDQVRTAVANELARREREQKQRLAAIEAERERESRQREEAQARERIECIERSHIAASEAGLVKAEKIQLGMSEAALLCSWGKPASVSRSVGAWGEHKQYVYGRGVYVYVENGKVTSWQD